jgi:hypothetical protein
MQWNFAAVHDLWTLFSPLRRQFGKFDLGSVEEARRPEMGELSPLPCRPRTISSATIAPRSGDIVTPLWVMAI